MSVQKAESVLHLSIENDKKYMEAMAQAVSDIQRAASDIGSVEKMLVFVKEIVGQSGKLLRTLQDNGGADASQVEGYFTIFTIAKKSLIHSRDNRLMPQVAIANLSKEIADTLLEQQAIADSFRVAVYDVQEVWQAEAKSNAEIRQDLETMLDELQDWHADFDSGDPEELQEKSNLWHVVKLALQEF